MGQAKIRLSNKVQLSLFNDLSTMLSAGIPVLDTIESLEPDAKGPLKAVLGELRRALDNGEPLADAMSRFPKSFDQVTVNLIRAAEAGGTLEDTLKDIVAKLKKQAAFSSNLRMAMIYPGFVMVIFTGILVLLLTFVIPRIGAVFTTMHTKVPFATQQLMKASSFFLHHWPVIIASVVVFVALFVWFASTHRKAIGRAILALPVFHRLGLNIDLARFTRSFELSLKAGVPLDETLALSKRTAQKKQIIAVIEQMQRSLNAGKPLATGLRHTNGVIPVMMARALETAEESATLESTLQSLAEHFDNQVDESLKAISSLLEPLMIMFVGLFVGILMVTVIAPIYTMTSKFKPGG